MKNVLVERYLYDVVRRLPEKQRKDIEEELRTLIEDMAEEKSARTDITDDVLKSVLEQLGDPAKLSSKFREEGNCLISGEYYTLYCQVLKIVLACVGAGMAVAVIVSFFVTSVTDSVSGWIQSLTGSFVDLFSIPSALIQAFGWVTLSFYVMQRKQVKLDQNEKIWNVKDLPEIPDKKAIISRGESIFGIVFGVLFIVMFICAPEFVGIWIKSSGKELISIPALNLSIWSGVLPFMIISLFVGIMDDLVKLINGRYNLAVMYMNIVSNCITIAMTFFIFKGHQIWNPDLVASVTSITEKTFQTEYDIMSHWSQLVVEGTLSNIFVAIIVIGSLIEMLVTIYRTLRYGMRGLERDVRS
ncbi:MAG TPA: hypothetical protein VJY54_12950 [Lachnospiraceae bacterium]|nr:hypothetical protein [Lachnospiraceae bacterium]